MTCAHHFLDCEQSSMILSLRGSGLRRLASAAAWSRVTQRHTDGIAPATIFGEVGCRPS